MIYYLAADGGGTKTDAVVFDCNGAILGKGTGKGGNALLFEAEKAFENVYTACADAMRAASLTGKDIQSGYLFIPGFSDLADRLSVMLGFPCRICDESEELHYTAFNGHDGIVVLSGTGSFATAYVGKNRYTAGGWGHIFGDEGSSYDIGAQALRRCAKNYDAGRTTVLMEAICKTFGTDDFRQCARKIYGAEDKRSTVASLCKLVCENASDIECYEILTEAAQKLIELATVCLRKSGKTRMPVALSGGLARSAYFKTLFAKAIERGDGSLYYHECQNDVIGGAVAMVLAENSER